MGKRYYCDYCERSFKDAQDARKKHLISLHHVKNREEHYNLYKDPEKILREELCKKPCLRFINQGECQFGTMCRYSHYTPATIQHLQAIVAARAEAKQRISYPDPEQIVKEFFDDTVDPEEVADKDINLWPLPPQLKDHPNLPPSLRPITYKDFDSLDFPEWGWR